MLDRLFRIRAAGSTPAREIGAGVTTFLTLCYVLFVHPAILAAAGMDPGGVLFATCVASALACFLMAWLANYPIALAPAMGHNVFFAFVVCGALGFSWQQALAANLCAGALFLALAGTRVRESVMYAIPEPLRFAIAAGIGLLIALLGLQWGGIVVDSPATLVALGDLGAPAALLSLFGLALTAVLTARGVRAAVLLGILATALAGWLATEAFDLEPRLVTIAGVVGAPPSPAGTAFALDFAGLFAHPLVDLLAVVATFLILDLFDTTGTLLGVADRAGLLEDGKLPRARGALAADAAGTVTGALLGTSTVTSYVESAAGVAAGGRTGLTAATVGVLLLLALFATPLIQAVGAGVEVAPGQVRYPVIAPALVLVGVLMAGAVARIRWQEPGDAIPAFLTIVLIPFSMSITDGIAFGMIAYSVLALATRRRAPALLHGLAVLFVARYVLA